MSNTTGVSRRTVLARTALALALAGAALLYGPLAASGQVRIDFPTTTTTVLAEELTGELPGDTSLASDILPPLDDPEPEPSPSSTTTTTAPTTPSTAPSSDPGADPTNAPGSAASAGSTVNALPSAVGLPAGGSSLGLTAPMLVPGFDLAFLESGSLFGREYTLSYGPRSTRDLVDLVARLGLGSDELVALLAPFPVAGSATYTDDWGAARAVPYAHRHQGTDIFAELGTAVIASSAGTVTRVGVRTAVGGNTVTVTSPDRTYYYYAHLDRHAEGLFEGQRVSVGQVLGYIGTTGNAQGTQPHLHYEIHPGGGAAVPPVPYLDTWLAEARASAASLAAASDPATVALLEIAGERTHVRVPRAASAPLEGLVPASAHSEQNPALTIAIVLALAALVLWRLRRRQQPNVQLTGARAGTGAVRRIDLRALAGPYPNAQSSTREGLVTR